jgi:hypothetical protein
VEWSRTSFDPTIGANHDAPSPSGRGRIHQTGLWSNAVKVAAARKPDRGAMAELNDEQRAALSMLATSLRGYSLPTFMACGFAYEMLQDLVRAGLARTQRDRVRMEKTRLAHLRITVAGR